MMMRGVGSEIVLVDRNVLNSLSQRCRLLRRTFQNAASFPVMAEFGGLEFVGCSFGAAVAGC